jgi:hypothetical protein
VIEGTMRDGNKVAATMENLRAAGYKIDARALAVNPKFSELGIMLRYEGQKADRGTGRMTTPEAHKAGYDGMLLTLDRIKREKLADRLTICKRNGEVIYSNELKNNQWACEPQSSTIVESERNRPFTLQEHKDYVQGFEKLAGLLANPKRQASTQEISNVQKLRLQAKSDLADFYQQQSIAENGKKTERQTVISALALAVVKKNGIDPEFPRGKQFMEAVGKEAAKCEAAGNLPKVSVLDAKAASKQTPSFSQAKSKTTPESDIER